MSEYETVTSSFQNNAIVMRVSKCFLGSCGHDHSPTPEQSARIAHFKLMREMCAEQGHDLSIELLDQSKDPCGISCARCEETWTVEE